MESRRPMLVMIGGPPWVGKTACAREVFEGLDNSAWLDGDDVWRVNPFSIQDPRLRNSDANMSFVLQTYLRSTFDYVVFSSVVLTDQPITSGILNAIGVPEYDIIFFMLICSSEALQSRSVERDGITSPDPRFDIAARARDAIQIDTSDMTQADVAARILSLVRDPAGAGLTPVSNRGVREWKKQESQNHPMQATPNGAPDG
jgi:cytidylate kinase